MTEKDIQVKMTEKVYMDFVAAPFRYMAWLPHIVSIYPIKLPSKDNSTCPDNPCNGGKKCKKQMCYDAQI